MPNHRHRLSTPNLDMPKSSLEMAMPRHRDPHPIVAPMPKPKLVLPLENRPSRSLSTMSHTPKKLLGLYPLVDLLGVLDDLLLLQPYQQWLEL